MPTLADITDKVRAGLAGEDSGLGKSLKFDFGAEGVLLIDGSSVSNTDAPADLTLSLSLEDLAAMAAGRLDPMTAVMSGRLKMSDMGAAMALQPQLQALLARL